MNKQELIRAVEKASTQTKGQADRVVDRIFGVRPAPKQAKGDSRKYRPLESEKLSDSKVDQP